MKAKIVSVCFGLYKVQYKKYFFSKWKDYMPNRDVVWYGREAQAKVIKMELTQNYL